jgi:hypothetical protein
VTHTADPQKSPRAAPTSGQRPDRVAEMTGRRLWAKGPNASYPARSQGHKSDRLLTRTSFGSSLVNVRRVGFVGRIVMAMCKEHGGIHQAASRTWAAWEAKHGLERAAGQTPTSWCCVRAGTPSIKGMMHRREDPSSLVDVPGGFCRSETLSYSCLGKACGTHGGEGPARGNPRPDGDNGGHYLRTAIAAKRRRQLEPS